MPRRSAATSDGAPRPNDDTTDISQTVSAGQLRAFIERVEHIEAEIAELQGDRKEIYAEAKGTGFDTRTIRELVKLRKQDQAERQERESILDLYKAALGMV